MDKHNQNNTNAKTKFLCKILKRLEICVNLERLINVIGNNRGAHRAKLSTCQFTSAFSIRTIRHEYSSIYML